VDFEAGSANRRGGVAIRMTPATQAGLQRCYRILQECKPWLARPDVLEKAKLPGRFQRPTISLSAARVSEIEHNTSEATAASNASSSPAARWRDRNHSHPPARSQRLVRPSPQVAFGSPPLPR
ncbi:hypothetical protein I553_2651, partial [Mycobacterium xenopi 4042]